MSGTYRIGFTLGDINGIGPEILAKILLDDALMCSVDPLIIGSAPHLLSYWQTLGLRAESNDSGIIHLEGRSIPLHAVASDAERRFGHVERGSGRLAGDAIVAGVELAVTGAIDAIVTMPIAKESMRLGGHDFPGHTEMLAELSGGAEPLMVLASQSMRVALLTVHLPIATAVRSIDEKLIVTKARTFAEALLSDWGIGTPRIALLGLNPHAGENGTIGREERTIYAPAIETLRAEGIDISDPFPADAFFSRSGWDRYDGIIASYHDQGLIPLKMYAKGGGVNVTCGLPIVRTSPDHGTGFDIAGKGIADHRSGIEATRMAIDIIAQRRRRATSSSAE